MMCKKLTLLASVIVVVGLVGEARADLIQWTGLGTDWCDAANWSGPVPGPEDVARFVSPSPVVIQGPSCDVNVGEMQGPAYNEAATQVMDIIDASVIVNSWTMVDSDDHGEEGAHATVNIEGSSVVKVLGGDWRGQDKGTFNLNILTTGSGDPNIYIEGRLKGGDNSGATFRLYMTGGYLNVRELDLDEGGYSPCTITGGTMILRNGGIAMPWGEFTLDGGADVNMNGGFACPSDDGAPIPSVVSLNSGTLICTSFNPNGDFWTLDIEEAVTWIIKGHHKNSIQPHIDAGRITGKDDTEPPSVIEYTEGEQNYTQVGFNLVQETAYNPSPTDGTGGICPNGVTLTWDAGIEADQHKIFFGTSEADVDSMTDPCDTKSVGDETFDAGWLEYGQSYFWRVDEYRIADPCTWRGAIWSFSTPSGKASDPSPFNNRRGMAPGDIDLSWTPPCWATGQTLYFGADMPERIVLLDDDFEDGFDPDWSSTTGWSPYNATGDSNFAPRDQNLAMATGSATLESGALDARFANALDVRIYVRRTEDITADELTLYYRDDGSNWDPVTDFNVVALGPNDTWLYFGDTITDDQYLTNNFGIKLVANITGGTVYVDDVRVRNTWPVDPNWLEADLSAADNNYPVTVSGFQQYYWRVDINDGNNILQGDYWGFRTGFGGLLMYYKFDGVGSFPASIPDDSDNDIEFTKYDGGGSLTYGVSNPNTVGSTASADFEPNMGLYRDDPCGPSGWDLLRLDGSEYTVEMWVMPRFLSTEQENAKVWLISKRDAWGLAMHGHNNFNFRWEWAGWGSTDNGTVEVGEWHHVAVVYDQADEDLSGIYLNGDKDDSGGGLLPSDNNNPVWIGVDQLADGNFRGHFDGLIDEIRIHDIALNPCEFLLLPGPEWPSCPTPYDGESEVDPCGVVLSWSPGSLATSHKVYFSTDFDDVNTFDPSALEYEGPNTSVALPDLDNGTTHYWRVVELGSGPWAGSVWWFTTEYKIEDANLILHYKFDEVSGDDAIDASGHGYHGDVDNEDWDPADGRFDGCLDFDDDTSVEPPRTVTTHLTNQVSISVWLNGEERDANNTVLDVSIGSDANYAMRVLVPDEDGDVIWRAGNDSCDVLLWDTATPDGWVGDWHHLVFIKDESAGTMSIYFDTELVKEKEGAISSLSNIVGKPFFIGDHTWSTSDYEGKMDDFRIYDYAIPKSKVEELFRGGELGIAWGPSPYDGQPDAHPAADLSWSPGDWAADVNGHEVYFGTNKQRVTDANNDLNYWPDVFKGKQDPNTYDPGTLNLGATYYWRVDEVNDACDPNGWRGDIWRFRVAPYIVVDNFDDDTAEDPPTYDWVNGNVLGTGAQISLRTTPPVIGEHSMSYDYSNFWDWETGYGYYSETETMSLEPNDWDYYDVRVISLWFYGQSGNDATEDETQMNLGLEDRAGPNYAVVLYGDLPEEEMTDVQVEEWQLWEVRTTRFTNINFSDVNKICIGFGTRGWPFAAGGGTVYFDEINLFVGTCEPDLLSLEGDFNRDCTVAWEDVEIMADDWLETDVNLSPVQPPNDVNLVGWWKLDEEPDSNVTDYAGYDNNGVIETLNTNVFWADAGHDGNAMRFDGGRVLVPDANALRPKYELTVCAWVKYYSTHDNSARIVVKGADNKETFGLEVSNEDDVCVFLVRDGNDYDAGEGKYESYDVNSYQLEHGDWTHLAGTFKQGDCIKIYVNGQLEATNNDANAVAYLCQDTGGLAIGNRSDATNRAFEGLIDDVQLYNRALPPEEIAYIATDETGFLAVQSIANLYNDEAPGDRAVNLRDFAKLSENWLKKRLWPE